MFNRICVYLYFLFLLLLVACGGGGTDDTAGSYNSSTYCDQTIIINIDNSENIPEEGDEVETESGEKVIINKIIKIDNEGPSVSVDAEVCTSETSELAN